MIKLTLRNLMILFVVYGVFNVSYTHAEIEKVKMPSSELVKPRSTLQENSEGFSKSKRQSILLQSVVGKKLSKVNTTTSLKAKIDKLPEPTQTNPSPIEQQSQVSADKQPLQDSSTVEKAEAKDIKNQEKQDQNTNTTPPPPGQGPGAADKSGVSQNIQLSTVNVEPFTGSANLAYPIQVPPGRGGIQPNIALTYNSGNRQLGLAGVGWNLDLGAIQVSTKKGVPKYDSTDIYTLIENGSTQELVYNPDNQRYRTETEASFNKIQKIADHWEVTDKKGTKYYFGATEDSRQFNPIIPERVFKWALNRVEDLNGNYMTISYMRDQGQIYPQSVSYTGFSMNSLVLSPFAQVNIHYADSSVSSTSYIQGFLVRTAKRISNIETNVNGIQQSKVNFNYIQSQDTNRDLLQSIIQIGINEGSNLPPVTFNYNQNGMSRFQLVSDWQIPPNDMSLNLNLYNYYHGRTSLIDSGVRIVDLNGDGYPDLIRSFNSEVSNPQHIWTSVYKAFLNSRNGWSLNNNWSLNNDCSYQIFCNMAFYDVNNLDVGSRMGDFNGDGIQDFAFEKNYSNQGVNFFITNSLGSINLDSSWSSPINFALNSTRGPNYYQTPSGVMIGDVNGDGFVDIIQSKSGEQGVYINQFYFGHKNFILNGLVNIPAGTYTDFTQGANLIDVNSDGLVDIFYRRDGASHVFMNTGSGFVEDTSSGWNTLAQYGDLINGSTQMVDVNGDGLIDMVVTTNGDRANAKILINTGSGWNLFQGSIGDINFFNYASQFLDFNSDGMMDYLTYETGSSPELFINQGQPSDILLSINNGVGAKSTITYDSSTHFNNTFLPFAFPVVKQVTTTVSNPVGADYSYTTRYDYAQGKWDTNYREFQGFGFVKVTDPQGNYTQSTFAQDHWLKGRPLTQESYDASGHLYAKSVNQWQTQGLTINEQTNQQSKFVFLSRSDNYLYDGSATPKRTAQAMSYEQSPQYGDVTRAINYGEVDPASGEDIGQDKLTTNSEYVNNASTWLLGLPKHVTVQDHSGNTVSQNWFYYDGSTDNDATPTKGQLTKKVDWLGVAGKPDPATRYSYDVYGNLLKTTDPMGNVTSITYDNDVHMFPVTTTNALGQQSQTVYYGVAGVAQDNGLWGQTKTVTDANNQTALSMYDSFGRPIKAVSPLDSVNFPTSEKSYFIASNYSRVISKARVEHGQGATIDTVEFYDGLGRLIETKTVGPNPGQWVVGGFTQYDNRGLPVKSYLPIFTSNDLNTLDTIDSSTPFVQKIYDAMGRAVRVNNPDGTYITKEYDQWTSTTIDENGHKSKSYADAFGRLIKKEEYMGADGRASDYPVTPYTLYATTNYSYDALGRLLSVRDAHNNITTIQYDNLGRKIGMNDPDMGHWQYEYDGNGNLIQQRDATNRKIRFTYDELNRLSLKTSINSKTSISNVSYTYDISTANYSKGRLGTVMYEQESASFKYDQLGREIESTKLIDHHDYRVSRQYDALNHLKQLQYPNAATVKYTYNQAGGVATISDVNTSTQYIKAIDYNALGQITQIQYGNGVSSAHTYNALNKRLIRIYTSNAQGQVLQDLNYVYDALGQIKSITDKINTGSRNFKYDALNRLIEAKDEFGNKTFAYDEIGNIIEKDGLRYQYECPGEGCHGKGGPHAVTSTSDGARYSYDSNGNMATKRTLQGLWRYEYDSQNRLTGVFYEPLGKAQKPIAFYHYDGDGGRTLKEVYRYWDAAYRNEQTYSIVLSQLGSLYFGSNEFIKQVSVYVGQLVELEEQVNQGQGRRETNYIFLGATRIAAVTGSEIDYYHMDHLGSGNVISDATGKQRSLIEYEAFGKISRFERFGEKIKTGWCYFNDKPLDDETGLMFYGARYYNPSLGRFITPDTIVQNPGGNPQTLNRYTYCNNNPVNTIDPTGHKWSWKKFWHGFVGAVVGAVVTVLTGGLGAPIAFALGGMVGGAITGGLDGGWKGALMGGLMGGVLGGAVGLGVGAWGAGFGYAALAAGGAYSIATGHADSFVGGLAGGIVGSAIGNGIDSYYNDGLAKADPERGIQPGKENIVEGRGVGTTPEKALTVANETGSRVLYTPSRGVAADIVRGGMQLLFGNSLASRQMAAYIQGHPGTIFNLHSEMTITALGAARQLGAEGAQVSAHFNLTSTFYPNQVAQSAFHNIGASVNIVPPNLGDSAGFFSQIFNPIAAPIYGVAGIATLEHYHSYETYKHYQ